MGVDAVVAWVDGGDKAHVRARRRYQLKERRFRPIQLIGTGRQRFLEAGELRYCIRGIRSHMPWVDRIFIVTDNQTPKFFDMKKATQEGVFIVDHKVIFKGHEDMLPNFNSLSIETVIWRIPELSDQFVYLNDDFFVVSETVKEDFFQGDIRVLRGTIADATIEKDWQDKLFANTARLLGTKVSEVFKPRHCPQAFSRSQFATLAQDIGPAYYDNLDHRFRSPDQFSVSGLVALDCIRSGNYVIDRKKRSTAVHLRRVKAEGKDRDQAVREAFELKGVMCVCINNVYALLNKGVDVHKYLDAHCGPALSFEK